jgi:hypothetical protein
LDHFRIIRQKQEISKNLPRTAIADSFQAYYFVTARYLPKCEYLNENNKTRDVVEGHTDTTSCVVENRVLSENIAKTINAELLKCVLMNRASKPMVMAHPNPLVIIIPKHEEPEVEG